MLSAEVTFSFGHNHVPLEDDLYETILAAWYKNGQIETSHWHVVRSNDHVRVLVWLPEANSLDQTNDNTYAREALSNLADAGFPLPSVRVLGTDAGLLPTCVCLDRPSLILFTSYCSFTSPVRCGSCFRLVPLYALPHVHGQEHLTILQWAEDYRACDTLQMHCTTGEEFAEGELSRHDSSLSQQGRSICKSLADQTGRSVFYFLLTPRGATREAELQRLCPSCSHAWHIESPWHGLFDFRCERCFLLSNIAYSLDT